MNISFKHISDACSNILKSNYMVPEPKAVIELSETQKFVETDPCLLSDESGDIVKASSTVIDGVTLITEDALKDIDAVIDEIPIIEPATEPPVQPEPIRKSIPFIVLNKEEDTMIQVVDRKMYLQFKANSLLDKEPTIIDYELVPDEIYMFIFNTNGFAYNMSLITPNKQVFEASGINVNGANLQPSIIGGNADLTESFCGNIIDVIVAKTGGKTIDYYKRSLLGYIPRTSQILFDFGVTNGDKVYNTINKVGSKFVNDTDALTSDFLAPTSFGNQKATIKGTVIKNDFYTVFDGYMDNFFCKDNLQKKDFTVSIWTYNVDCTSHRNIILSDDINDHYIYYDAVDDHVIIDFKDAETIIVPYVLNEWTQFTLRHSLFISKYELIIENSSTKVVHDIVTTKPFALMSIFAEYDYKSKRYINQFQGLLSTVSIFLNTISDEKYYELHREQLILVRGMEL